MTGSPATDGGAGSRHFIGLDLIRGIAALAVLVYHVDFMFGLRGSLLSGGYTAVDLFFIVSGFVIAKTYEDDVRSGEIGFAEMARRRLARLYPLYFATTTLGLFIVSVRYRANFGYYDTPSLVGSAAANLILLPTPSPVYDNQLLFPFNAASWSIFYELAANVAFFLVFARARSVILVGMWMASGAAVIATIHEFGGLDVGWGSSNGWAAVVRVCFSFLSGMLIWRAYQIRRWSTPRWVLVALVAAHILAMQLRGALPDMAKPWSDFGVVAFLLPLIVVASVGARFDGGSARVGRLLGDVSYAVYLTQDALIIAAAGLTQALLHRKIYDLAPIPGIVFVPLCALESYVVFKYFEMPARRLVRSSRFSVGGAKMPDRFEASRTSRVG